MKIFVRKDSEFFIAMCEFKGHSYMALGVQHDSGEKEFLAAFGKALDKRKQFGLSSCFKFFYKALFSYVDAYIMNENIISYDEKINNIKIKMRPKSQQINYKAYAITYKHYVEFLNYMAKVSAEQQKKYDDDDYFLEAYLPVPGEENEGRVKLKWNYLIHNEVLQGTVETNENQLALSNTCRHSAVALTEKGRQSTDLGAGVSSFFLDSLPLTAQIDSGKVVIGKTGSYFYVLPLPPSSFEVDERKKQILNDLYKRLNEIPLIAQNDELTILKFQKLKALYSKVAIKVPDDDIFKVMESIENWKSKNEKLINSHRRNTFWNPFATGTKKMFDKFHGDFARIREEIEQNDLIT